jgi:nucleoid-associated protein YgaU
MGFVMAENTRVLGGVAALGFLLLCAVGGYFYAGSKMMQTPPPAAAPAPAPAPAPPPPTPAPQFDVVRVDPSGNAVIAGRAAPGAVVTIKAGTSVLGTVTADADGAFAFVPDSPLPAGPKQLSLSEALAGGKVIAGPATASIDVPAKPNVAPLAVVSGPTGSKIISGQGPQTGTLGIGAVDYDANGHAIFSGTAPAGEHVALALGGAKLGDAVAGPDGRWSFAATVPKQSGTLSLADSAAPPGAKAAVTAPFALETLQDAVADGNIVIAPGQNLWLIARHVYGHGNMYTLIYQANQSQIQDPNLIFPGQAFSLPKPKG